MLRNKKSNKNSLMRRKCWAELQDWLRAWERQNDQKVNKKAEKWNLEPRGRFTEMSLLSGPVCARLASLKHKAAESCLEA